MKPIIMNTFSAQGILKGIKTQTRRVIKNNLGVCNNCWNISVIHNGKDAICGGLCYLRVPCCDENDEIGSRIRPKYEKDQILWVRETWQYWQGATIYKADFTKKELDEIKYLTWKPSIFMPRKAARIFLKVKNIKIERIQEITEEDAIAEGIIKGKGRWGTIHYRLKINGDYQKDKTFDLAVDAYKYLWDSINNKRGYGWEKNPFIYVIDFEVLNG